MAGSQPVPGRPAAGDDPAARRAGRPSPHHLAELSGAFAMTAGVHDPEPISTDVEAAEPLPDHHLHEPHLHAHHVPDHDDANAERGLRGLVGGGASQVNVAAAMRARDAARPSDDDLAAAERDLTIVRRGWVPREDLPRPGRR
jgi:hypothetical protein